MATEMADLIEATKRNGDGLNALTKSLTAVVDKLAKTPANGPNHSDVFGAPNVRSGEDSMSSRGYSFMKMMGVLTGACPPEKAKIERDVHERMNKLYCTDMGAAGYGYGGAGMAGEKKFLAPLATSFMHEDIIPRDFRREMKSLVTAGTDGADHDEMKWIRTKQLQAMGYSTKSLS